MMNYYSALDRGNEAIDDGVNIRMPSGSAMPWGNRDYDVNLVVADKAWDQTGQLWFNPFNTDGFIGDRLTVNWQCEPVLDVRARRYRFRILNGSVSRFFSIGLVQGVRRPAACELPGPKGSNLSYKRIPFHMVANDGNLMEHTVPFDGTMDLDGDGDLQDHNAVLPTQGIAERYDIVVDFAKNGLKAGDKLYFVNTMHHDTGIAGQGPHPAGRHPVGEVQAGAEDRHRRHAAVGQGRSGRGQVHADATSRPTPASTRAWTRTQYEPAQARQGRSARR